VADLWGGTADVSRERPWGRDTIACMNSATKGATVVCALLLTERGDLNLDAPIAEVWPEFAAQGKEVITLRMVMAHRAGLAHIEGFSPEKSGERDLEVAAPLGLDLWIGLPEEEEFRYAPFVEFDPRMRHGESEWNASNQFAGWVNVALTAAGEAEAARAGGLLAEHGLLPGVVHTSVQQRTIRAAAAAARRRRGVLAVRRSPLCGTAARGAAARRVAQGRDRAAAALLVRRDSPGPAGRRVRPGRLARHPAGLPAGP
jgi:hypothetical protein